MKKYLKPAEIIIYSVCAIIGGLALYLGITGGAVLLGFSMLMLLKMLIQKLTHKGETNA